MFPHLFQNLNFVIEKKRYAFAGAASSMAPFKQNANSLESRLRCAPFSEERPFAPKNKHFATVAFNPRLCWDLIALHYLNKSSVPAFAASGWRRFFIAELDPPQEFLGFPVG